MAKKTDIKSYEAAMEELEEILSLLESNELKIDVSRQTDTPRHPSRWLPHGTSARPVPTDPR